MTAIVVMERHTGRLVTGAHAPVADNLIPWLTQHPSFEVLRPGQQKGHVSTTTFYNKQKTKHGIILVYSYFIGQPM